MASLQYVTFDSIQEGVGASQVFAYLQLIAKVKKVELISFEKETPGNDLLQLVEEIGITWKPLPYGRHGSLGGLNRVWRISNRIDAKSIVHARGNFAAISVMVTRHKNWIWDCRSLESDQRLAIKGFNFKSTIEFLFLSLFELFIARRSSRIIVITNAVVEEFESRYRISKEKILVVPTCANLEKFKVQPDKPSPNPLKILMSGTFSAAYDFNLINEIVSKLRTRYKVDFTIATSKGTTELWKKLDYDSIVSVPHSEMPSLVASQHLGISIWRDDLGKSLLSVASTKTAEFLASGVPIIVNHKQGDFGVLIEKSRVGIATRGYSQQKISEYVGGISELLEDPDTSGRCRNVAESYLDLNAGVKLIISLYQDLEDCSFDGKFNT